MNKSTTGFSTVLTTALALGVFASTAGAVQITEFSDFDGDGVISAEEILEARKADKEAALLQYDTDGNGELSRLERRSMKDDRHAGMLEQFDADGDGELSRAERRDAHDARRAAVLLLLDVNQDGVLSEEEQAGFEQLRKERKADGRARHGHSESGNRI